MMVLLARGPVCLAAVGRAVLFLLVVELGQDVGLSDPECSADVDRGDAGVGGDQVEDSAVERAG
jgi:hypothetical protein